VSRPVYPAKAGAGDVGSFDVAALDALIELARREDLGEAGDITSQTVIDQNATGAAAFVARAEGVLAGAAVVDRVFAAYDAKLAVLWGAADGMAVTGGQRLGTVSGSLRSILAAERVALNFLCRLSGIATATSRYVRKTGRTKAVIVDTRKTAPGWRSLEKYAVRCGGGVNHRMGLHDMVLVKDNHRAARGLTDLAPLVAAIRQRVPNGIPIEVEVDDLDQFARVLDAGADIIMLDNMSVEDMAEAVQIRDAEGRKTDRWPLLEASGRITLANVRQVAQTGVDRIAIGAITHSAPILDIGLDLLTEHSGGDA